MEWTESTIISSFSYFYMFHSQDKKLNFNCIEKYIANKESEHSISLLYLTWKFQLETFLKTTVQIYTIKNNLMKFQT